ncbi:MAG: DUF58 domain-containing protein [Pseudomonadota bacterium]
MLDPDALMRLRHLIGSAEIRAGATALPGGHVTRRRGRGLEIAEIRPFAHGDDPRHVDRNATARTGQLQVRSFLAERDRTTLLLADFRPSMLWGTRRVFRSVAAAEQLCVLGWRAVEAGGRVALIAATAAGPFHTGAAARTRGMLRVIGTLAQAHRVAMAAPLGADPPLTELLDLAETLSPRGAEIWLASGFDSRGVEFDDTVTGLMRRAELGLIRIADPFEDAPRPGLYRFRESSGALRSAQLGGARARLPKKTDPGAAPQDPVQRLAEAHGLPLRRVDSGIDPLAPLIQRSAVSEDREARHG